MLGNTNYIRNLVIFGFISNEGISILENASLLEIPIPDKVKSVLKQLKNTEVENSEIPKKNDWRESILRLYFILSNILLYLNLKNGLESISGRSTLKWGYFKG